MWDKKKAVVTVYHQMQILLVMMLKDVDLKNFVKQSGVQANGFSWIKQ